MSKKSCCTARRATGAPNAGVATDATDLPTILLQIRALGSLLICSHLASNEQQDWASVGQAGQMIVAKSENALALYDEVLP